MALREREGQRLHHPDIFTQRTDYDLLAYYNQALARKEQLSHLDGDDMPTNSIILALPKAFERVRTEVVAEDSVKFVVYNHLDDMADQLNKIPISAAMLWVWPEKMPRSDQMRRSMQAVERHLQCGGTLDCFPPPFEKARKEEWEELRKVCVEVVRMLTGPARGFDAKQVLPQGFVDYEMKPYWCSRYQFNLNKPKDIKHTYTKKYGVPKEDDQTDNTGRAANVQKAQSNQEIRVPPQSRPLETQSRGAVHSPTPLPQQCSSRTSTSSRSRASNPQDPKGSTTQQGILNAGCPGRSLVWYKIISDKDEGRRGEYCSRSQPYIPRYLAALQAGGGLAAAHKGREGKRGIQRPRYLFRVAALHRGPATTVMLGKTRAVLRIQL
ncbi:unnamed protein product [Cylicocyclus nassatus]|uniref:Uncharacterized protein n=1 Tax=Cylicocyclus nassatus TaxID=53992 RepID=A0AA36GNU2_CYLNA|nr:unnamed protein product [Cylicocyclus nassatus]